MSNQKYYYLEILRIIACVLVLFNHTINTILPRNDMEVFIFNFIFMLSKIAVPIFFMISGYVLLKRDYSYKELYLNKFVRIFIAVFGCTILISLIRDNFNIISIIKSFFTEPIFIAYWYLYTLLGIYLIVPFLRKMIKNFTEKDFKIFSLIILIIPGIILFLNVFISINISKFFTDPLFHYSLGYLVVGYWLGNKTINKKQFNISLVVFVISIMLTIILLQINYINSGNNTLILDNIGYITTIIPSISAFLIIKHVFENKIPKNKMLLKISECTFGIYLFHMIILHRVSNLGFIIKAYELNPFLGVFTIVTFIFILLVVVTMILKKLPVIRKIL